MRAHRILCAPFVVAGAVVLVAAAVVGLAVAVFGLLVGRVVAGAHL